MLYKKNLKLAKRISSILSCLANPNRLMITCFLIEGEKSAGDILNEIGTTKGNISQHLKLLELHGILKSRKEGNRVYYSIRDYRIKKLIYYIRKIYCSDIKFGQN